MAVITPASVKSSFVGGAVPSVQDFTDFIDTGFNSGDTALDNATSVGIYPAVLEVESTNDATLLPTSKVIGISLLGTETTASARQYTSAMSFGDEILSTDTMSSAITRYGFGVYGITGALGANTSAEGLDAIGCGDAGTYDAATSGASVAVKLQADERLANLDGRSLTHKGGFGTVTSEVTLDSVGLAEIEVSIGSDVNYILMEGAFEHVVKDVLVLDAKLSGENYTNHRIKGGSFANVWFGTEREGNKNAQTPLPMQSTRKSVWPDRQCNFELTMHVTHGLSGRSLGGGHYDGFAWCGVSAKTAQHRTDFVLDGAALTAQEKNRLSHIKVFPKLLGNMKNGFVRVQKIRGVV